MKHVDVDEVYDVTVGERGRGEGREEGREREGEEAEGDREGKIKGAVRRPLQANVARTNHPHFVSLRYTLYGRTTVYTVLLQKLTCQIISIWYAGIPF